MYIQLYPTKAIRGVKFSFDSYAFYRDPPIPIMITMGYDPSNKVVPWYLHIEMQSKKDMDYASPQDLDGCMYNSLADPDLPKKRKLLLWRYLNVFIKYSIFIPLEFYQILKDVKYCDPKATTGYFSMGSRYELDYLATRANRMYADNPLEYYKSFLNLLKKLDYQHPLSEKISAYGTNPPPAEEDLDYAADDEIGEDAIAEQDYDCKTDYIDMSFYQPQPYIRKNRLTLGEGDFSYAEAFCRKHPQLIPKIITTEYRPKVALEQEYDVHRLVIMQNIETHQIKEMANHTVVLLGEKGRYRAHLILNGAFIKPAKQSPPYMLPIELDSSDENVLIPDVTTKMVLRTTHNNYIIDKIFSDVLSAFRHPPYVKSFSSHAFYLENAGAQMLYGIDAQKIHVHFRGYKFSAIHFNCPHMPGDSKGRALPAMLHNFFQSAALLQAIGDKIYMALPYPADTAERNNRTSYIYKVYDAAAESGYKLIKKRKFDDVRYPGYVHRMTEKARSAKVAEQIREYVFRRIEPLTELPQAIHYKSPADAKEHYSGTQFEETGHILPDPPTDDESSVYDSDEQQGVSDSDNDSAFIGAVESVTYSRKKPIAEARPSKQLASFFYPPHQIIDGRIVLGCDAPPGSTIEKGRIVVPGKT